MITHTHYLTLIRLSIVMALCVIMLGAYVRLSDAGLGCPDWPGCYGKMLVPQHDSHIDEANQAWSQRPLEQDKAWKEMVHRYLAGFLGLAILLVAIAGWHLRRRLGQSPVLPLAILGLVVFQALLGMWTVTLLLKPIIVVAHLLGGMTVLLLLWWLMLRLVSPATGNSRHHGLFPWVLLGFIVLYTQIFLGGWTSANYAALACSDVPTCQSQWLPPMDFAEGFTLWRGLGQDYEYGVLDAPARTAIHVAHRIGAVVTLLLLAGVALWALRTGHRAFRLPAVAVLVLLVLQVTLGVMNIVHVLPLPIAVAHNGGAALLLISVATLLYHASSINHPVRP